MKKLHLICNAHIDPIWQWPWDEGIAAAIATYKSAADLTDKFDYIFCHNESLLYEEIQKNAPALFAKIKELVKQKKWAITGGWYLQPDCLFPCGESIVRQIKTGQEYFKQKFGMVPEIATNYDSFGHSLGLVQIMKKCGYKGYLICRPYNKTQFGYPSKFFKWVSPDGSSIIVSNSASYATPLGEAAQKIKEHIYGEDAALLGVQNKDQTKSQMPDVDYLLWGVGNHGGGPSAKDLQDIADLKIDGVQIIHSTPERLFDDDISVKGEVTTSLVTCMPGCYSSMARTKQAHRQAENLFYGTEKMLAVAKMAGYSVDLSNWETAQKKLLFSQFHDILPGTSAPEAEQEGMELLATATKIIKDYRTGAYLYLVMGEDAAKPGEYPVFVFNHMPYWIKTPVEAEFILASQNHSQEFYYQPYVYTEDGTEIPSQTIKEGSTLNLDWRKRVVFEAQLKPLGITRFDIRVKQKPVTKKQTPECTLQQYLDKNPLLNAPVGLELYDDTADPWGMSMAELKNLGKNPKDFCLMDSAEAAEFCGFEGHIQPVHIIEDGDIMTAVECLYTAGKTNAAIEYRFYKNQPFVDLKVTVEFAHKNKLVRLKVPAPKGTVVGDGPYIVEEKPLEGEITFQKWVGVKDDDGQVFGIINDGLYGGKADKDHVYITLLRGAGHCFHPIYDRELYPKDRYLPRIDNGRYTFKFRIYRGDVTQVCAQAELFNQLPYAVSAFPTGEGKKQTQLQIDQTAIMPVCKISEDGYTMRFYNPKDQTQEVTLLIGKSAQRVTLKPYQIVSVKYDGKFTISPDKILY